MAKEKNIIDIMNKQFSNTVKPEEVKYWYDIGNYAINYTMSKQLKAGIPSGRIVCFDGLSGTGKSLFACNVAKDPNFDLIVIIDTEGGGIGKELLSYVGADISKVILLKASTFESYKINKKTKKIDRVAEKDMPSKLENNDYLYVEGATFLTKKLINSVYYDPTLKDKKILVILDSIANLQSVREMNGTSDMGARSQEIGRFFRTFDTVIEKTGISLVITNKLYTNIGNDYVPLVAAGGNNVVYNSSIILRLTETVLSDDVAESDIKGNREQKKTALGSNFKTLVAKSIKSRFGTEGKSVQFLLETSSGLVRHSGLFKMLRDYGVINKTSGAWYECKSIFGDKKFYKKNFITLLKEDGKEDERIDLLQIELSRIEDERINKIQNSLECSSDDIIDEDDIDDEVNDLKITISDFSDIDNNIREDLIKEIED